MRKKPTDNYENFALLGNNIYDVIFMNYLFSSQNVSSHYCELYIIHDKNIENILKNIAYYFGTRGPILIDEEGLEKIFVNYNIPRVPDSPRLASSDIIKQINICLESDAVYVCNPNGELDKYTMFILGYLMAMEQEIFFWSDIKSEWLMDCIAKRNVGHKEVIQFPLEIIRSFAYPYLFKNVKTKLAPGKYAGLIVDEKGNIGVEGNIEFNLHTKNQHRRENTVSLLGSLNKQLEYIKEQAIYLKENGYEILAPQISGIKTEENSFIIFESDISNDPITIETDFIENCLKSENIIVCDKDGYIGNTVMFEIGYLLAKNKHIEFLQSPSEEWLMDVMKHFSKSGNSKKTYISPSYQKAL